MIVTIVLVALGRELTSFTTPLLIATPRNQREREIVEERPECGGTCWTKNLLICPNRYPFRPSSRFGLQDVVRVVRRGQEWGH